MFLGSDGCNFVETSNFDLFIREDISKTWSIQEICEKVRFFGPGNVKIFLITEMLHVRTCEDLCTVTSIIHSFINTEIIKLNNLERTHSKYNVNTQQ